MAEQRLFLNATTLLDPAWNIANWWQFASLPSSWFADKDHQKQYMQWLGQTLQITSPEGWYDKISFAALANHFGPSLRLPLLNLAANQQI